MKIKEYSVCKNVMASSVIVSSMIFSGITQAGDNEISSVRPLSEAGVWLNDNGITPHLIASQLWLGNPSTGITTSKHEALTMFMAGADFNLDKMNVIPGGKIHFMQLWVPFTHNLEYGSQVGGLLAGNPPPYIPKVPHLMRFTYEQGLLNDQLSIEAGKSNPGQFFGFTNCNISQSCVNTVLNETAGFAPPPYAGWGLRARYQFTPMVESGIGAWRTYSAFPFTNGWERSWRSDDWRNETSLFLVNVARRANWVQETYPFNWEIMGFHNNKEYDDAFYTVNGTSKVLDSSAAAKTHRGVSGLYLTAKKAVWRRDGGLEPGNPIPSAISLQGSLTQTLQSHADKGIATLVDAGVIWSGPWSSRPVDSYGLTFRWAKLTEGEQRFLQDAFNVTGGEGWHVPRNEYQMSLDANIVLTPELILQMTAARTWNANNWQSPYTSTKPENGYSFWLQMTVLLDKLLGL